MVMIGATITLSVYRHSLRDALALFSHGLVNNARKQTNENFPTTPTKDQNRNRHHNMAAQDGLVRTGHGNNITTFHLLPPSVISKVKFYVFFVGVERSGHSIVGAILDSHPHIVISNEFNVFRNLPRIPYISKSLLFNKIWRTSYQKATAKKSSLHSTDKGYSLAIDNLYQGMYESYIDVIGDKMGGDTSVLYFTDPVEFEYQLNMLRDIIDKIPFKVFHVIRNPFDNIATIALYEYISFQVEIALIKSGNETLTLDTARIFSAITHFFLRYQAAEDIKQRFDLDVMEIHNKDLISNPKVIIQNICVFLNVFCSDEYLNTVSDKIFKDESKTRYNVLWTNDHITKVKENILKHDNLKQYFDFNS